MKTTNGSSATCVLLSAEEQEAVRRQLGHILASQLFRNSKRFPDFLRYTVEEALSGNYNDLKERTLGIEVFGRDPAYDTNSDPVVRMTAGEVRKRLAQYYQVAGHENELRIEFPRGSYVPEFRFPTATVAEEIIPVTPVTVPAAETAPAARSVLRRMADHRYIAVAAFALAALLLFGASRLFSRETAYDRFWSPFVNSSSPVLVCIPDLTASLPPPPAIDGTVSTVAATNPTAAALAALPPSFRRNRVTFGDSLAASMLTGVLGSEKRPFRLRRADDANLQDLEEGPVILIGGRSSNQWSLKLDDELRFGLMHDGDTHYIGDRQNPSVRQWSLTRAPNQPEAKISNDYAIISRVFDPTTGHPLLTAAGLFQYGTEAAGMCLSTPSCLESAEQLAPGDWKHKNLQIVIATTIINENAGEPRVLKAYAW